MIIVFIAGSALALVFCLQPMLVCLRHCMGMQSYAPMRGNML